MRIQTRRALWRRFEFDSVRDTLAAGENTEEYTGCWGKYWRVYWLLLRQDRTGSCKLHPIIITVIALDATLALFLRPNHSLASFCSLLLVLVKIFTNILERTHFWWYDLRDTDSVCFKKERLQTSQTGCCTVFSFLGPAPCAQLTPLLFQRYVLSQKGSCQCDSQVSTNSSKLEDLPSWVSFWLLSLKAVILEWLFMWFALFHLHNCKIQELQFRSDRFTEGSS